MKFDRRITNGLAWAGVVLVVGVPVADLLSGQFSGEPAPVTAQVAMIEPVAPVPAPLSQRPAIAVAPPAEQVAVVAPAKPAAPVAAPPVVAAAPAVVAKPTITQTADAVDRYLQSGKPMPSYIAGSQPAAPAQVAATPPVRTPIVTTPAPIDPVQVASIQPSPKTAPVPMPLSMRPKFTPAVAAAEPVVIVPERVVTSLPPADVTAGELQDWESGPLSEFLASRQRQGNAASGYAEDSDYDPDGFFLNEGPNRRVGPQPRYIGPATDTFFFPFSN